MPLCARQAFAALSVAMVAALCSCHEPEPVASSEDEGSRGALVDATVVATIEACGAALEPGWNQTVEGRTRVILACTNVVSDDACRADLFVGLPLSEACRQAYCPDGPRGEDRPLLACPREGETWDDDKEEDYSQFDTVVWDFMFWILEREAGGPLLADPERDYWIAWLQYSGPRDAGVPYRKIDLLTWFVDSLEEAGRTRELMRARATFGLAAAWEERLQNPWYTEPPRPWTLEVHREVEAWDRIRREAMGPGPTEAESVVP